MSTRRTVLKSGLATLGAASLPGLAGLARAQDGSSGDAYDTARGGTLAIHPVQHASFVMGTPAGVVYGDPVGGAGLHEGLPRPDLILLTHEHGDHCDVPTLEALVGDDTVLVTNPAVHGMLPEALKSKATAIVDGESTEALGTGIDAIPAHGLTQERLQFHPEGRDNGYVLDVDVVLLSGPAIAGDRS